MAASIGLAQCSRNLCASHRATVRRYRGSCGRLVGVMKNQDPPPPTVEEVLIWLASEQNFGTSFIASNFSQITQEDAEDIYSDFCIEQFNLGENQIKFLRRGVLVRHLRWKGIDFIRRRRTARRGSGVRHEDIVEFQDRIPDQQENPLASIIKVGEWQCLKSLLDQVRDRCNRRQSIFAQVAADVLEKGEVIGHWSEAFSPEQRREFMATSRGDYNNEEEAFRREVNRTCRQVTAMLQKLFRTNDVLWPN